jgi:hypothetical protein
MMTQRHKTAIHEAGHACCALLLGIPNIGAVVFDAGGGVASATPETETPRTAEDYPTEMLAAMYQEYSLPELMRDATYIAAGHVAVTLATDPMGTVYVTGPDMRMITAACQRAFAETDAHVWNAFEAIAIARARCLLGPCFHRVRAVADELDRCGMMTADQIAMAMFPEAKKQ